MFESFLKLCAKADLISFLSAVLQNYRNGPIVGYAISPHNIWITKVLPEKGIKVWGIVFVGDELLFSVRLTQAHYTQYWLEREGVLYRGGIGMPVEKAINRKTKDRSNWSISFNKALTGINRFVDKI